MNRILSSLPMNEKLAVVQLGYQLIGSAKQAPLTEEDDPSIDYIIDSIGLAIIRWQEILYGMKDLMQIK